MPCPFISTYFHLPSCSGILEPCNFVEPKTQLSNPKASQNLGSQIKLTFEWTRMDQNMVLNKSIYDLSYFFVELMRTGIQSHYGLSMFKRQET